MNKRHGTCERCQWPLPLDCEEKICPECNRVELFKLAARIALKAILTEKNLLLRVRLIQKFFGVCVNVWETHSVLGAVPSADHR